MTRNKRRLVLGGFLVSALLIAAAVVSFVVLATPVGTGLAAKQLCSLVFVSRLAPERAIEHYVNPLIGPLRYALTWQVDPTTRQTRASALGWAEARAVAHSGYGCVQMLDRSPAQIADRLPERAPAERSNPAIVTGPYALQEALARVLDLQHTYAALIWHDGEVIAEAYADGITPHTPLPGWSMAKSLTTTLAGVLAKEGLLAADEVALFPAWEEDERVHVRFENLLRMTSGLDMPETRTGLDTTTHMLFKTGDSATYASQQAAVYPPGEHFAYSSGSTVLAAGVITDRLGGPEAAYRFLNRRLLAPLTMHHTILEPDEAGTMIGSSFVLSTPRDWAKLGALYLNDGMHEGRRLLPEGWLTFVTAPTAAATERGYGAGFWLARPAPPKSPEAEWPSSAFFASGLQSNRLVILPEQRLLVVRLGATGDIAESGIAELVAAALAYVNRQGSQAEVEAADAPQPG